MAEKGSMKPGLLAGLLAVVLALEEGVVRSVTDGFYPDYGNFFGDGSFEWLLFAVYVLPTFLLAPFAALTDLRIGRDKALVWGLWILAGGLLLSTVSSELGMLFIAIGNALFLPSAFLTLAVPLSPSKGQRESGFIVAWFTHWMGYMVVAPLVFTFLDHGVWRFVTVVALILVGFVLKSERVGILGNEPPAVPRKKGYSDFPIFPIGAVALGVIGLWMVLQLFQGLFEVPLVHNNFLLGVTMVATLGFLLFKGKRRLWLGIVAFLVFCFGMLHTHTTGVIPMISSISRDYVGYGISGTAFVYRLFPFLLAVFGVWALSRFGPDLFRSGAGLLVRVIASVIVVGILGWLLQVSDWSMPLYLVYFTMGLGASLGLPVLYFLIWRNSPPKFKVLSIALTMILLRFSYAGQEFTYHMMGEESSTQGFESSFMDVQRILFMLCLLVAAGTFVYWLRSKKA